MAHDHAWRELRGLTFETSFGVSALLRILECLCVEPPRPSLEGTRRALMGQQRSRPITVFFTSTTNTNATTRQCLERVRGFYLCTRGTRHPRLSFLCNFFAFHAPKLSFSSSASPIPNVLVPEEIPPTIFPTVFICAGIRFSMRVLLTITLFLTLLAQQLGVLSLYIPPSHRVGFGDNYFRCTDWRSCAWSLHGICTFKRQCKSQWSLNTQKTVESKRSIHN